MKKRQLPIDPNTKKPFRDREEMTAWLVLEQFIITGRRSTSSNNKLKVA